MLNVKNRMKWWDEQNRCTYDNVKTTGSCGTPCKCCSKSQQWSSPGLRLRLTVLFVLIERVWWISHYFIASSALDNRWQCTFHTPVVEEVAGPRDICQAVLTATFISSASWEVTDPTNNTLLHAVVCIMPLVTSAVVTWDCFIPKPLRSVITKW